VEARRNDRFRRSFAGSASERLPFPAEPTYPLYSMIRTLSVALLAVTALALAADTPSTPQGGGSGARRRYDPAAVETISGEVLRIDRIPSRRGTGTAVHLAVRASAGETVDVRLGPAWWVDGQNVRVKENDKVEVKGSRVSIGGAPVVIAAVVNKKGKTLVLRNDAGVPAWAGQKAPARQE
jgi:hypothetical protein